MKYPGTTCTDQRVSLLNLPPNGDQIKNFLSTLITQLPTTLRNRAVEVVAEYHSIWVIQYSSSILQSLLSSRSTASKYTNPTSLVLRVANVAIPHLKTINEVAVLRWLTIHTSLPVPTISHYDSGTDNALSAKYIFMSRVKGITASEFHDDVLANQDNMDSILTQMAHFPLELFRHPFSRLGGLKIDPKRIGEIVVGPPMNEHYYQAPQISKYWPNDEIYESLNPSSTDGYTTFIEWVADHVRKYIHGICISSTMQKFRQHTPWLQNFVSHIEQTDFREKVNDVPLRLAHNDLHFGQFLVDTATLEITGLLDWEFASVVPFPLWRRSFLMNLGLDYETAVKEREQLYKRFEEIVARLQGGEAMLKAMRWKHREQELLCEVCDKLRSIVQMCVYGKGEGRENTWMERVLHCLNELGVKED